MFVLGSCPCNMNQIKSASRLWLDCEQLTLGRMENTWKCVKKNCTSFLSYSPGGVFEHFYDRGFFLIQYLFYYYVFLYVCMYVCMYFFIYFFGRGGHLGSFTKTGLGWEGVGVYFKGSPV